MLSVTRRNLSQAVAEEILTSIRNGSVRPGDRLPTERGLMTQFQVGRNAIREAVQSLVARGVLDVRPGRGATVLGIATEHAIDRDTLSALLDDHAVLDVHEFREIVEVAIAPRASERATPEDIQRITTALGAFRQALVDGAPVYGADIEFHRAVAKASHNPVFVRVLDAVSDLLSSARQATEQVPGTKERALLEHEEILRAIADHDSEAARSAMVSHLATAAEAIRRTRNAEEVPAKPPVMLE